MKRAIKKELNRTSINSDYNAEIPAQKLIPNATELQIIISYIHVKLKS
ncbi:hypothetical protein ACP8HZ_08510 [Francisella noatunensis]